MFYFKSLTPFEEHSSHYDCFKNIERELEKNLNQKEKDFYCEMTFPCISPNPSTLNAFFKFNTKTQLKLAFQLLEEEKQKGFDDFLQLIFFKFVQQLQIASSKLLFKQEKNFFSSRTFFKSNLSQVYLDNHSRSNFSHGNVLSRPFLEIPKIILFEIFSTFFQIVHVQFFESLTGMKQSIVSEFKSFLISCFFSISNLGGIKKSSSLSPNDLNRQVHENELWFKSFFNSFYDSFYTICKSLQNCLFAEVNLFQKPQTFNLNHLNSFGFNASLQKTILTRFEKLKTFFAFQTAMDQGYAFKNRQIFNQTAEKGLVELYFQSELLFSKTFPFSKMKCVHVPFFESFPFHSFLLYHKVKTSLQFESLQIFWNAWSFFFEQNFEVKKPSEFLKGLIFQFPFFLKNENLNLISLRFLMNTVFQEFKDSTVCYVQKIKQLTKLYSSQKQSDYIRSLNREISVWSYCFQHFYALKEIQAIDQSLFQFIWKWAVRRHGKKSKTWIYQKYFFVTKDCGPFFGDSIRLDFCSNCKLTYLPLYFQRSYNYQNYFQKRFLTAS